MKLRFAAEVLLSIAGDASAQVRPAIPDWESAASGSPLLSAIWADSVAYALDGRRNVIVVYDRRGELRREFGGPTDPAGALQAPLSIGLLGDSVWVHDAATQQVRVYGVDAGLRQVTRVPLPDSNVARHFFAVRAVGADGSLLLEENVPNQHVDAMMREGRIMLRTNRDNRTDTVARLSQENAVMLLRLPHGGLTMREQPWAYVDLFTPSSDGAVTATVRQSPGKPTRVEWQRLRDTVRVHRNVPAESEVISKAEVERTIDKMLTAGLVSRFADRDAARRAIREALFVPSTAPHASRLLVGRDGTVWLRRRVDSRCEYWQVLSRSREVAPFDVCLPLGVRIEDVGSTWALGVVSVPQPESSEWAIAYKLVRFTTTAPHAGT